MRSRRSTVVLAAAAGWLALLAAPGVQTATAADTGKAERTISVSATGRTTAEPDLARVTVGIVNDAETAKEAVARNSAAMARLVDGLKGGGIARELQTTTVSVSPRYGRPTRSPTREIEGYRAVNEVRLTVRDIKRLGEVLDQATTLGANRIRGISLDVADAETLRDEARKRAMENARRRGELYASAAGGQLGPVLRIAETTGDPRPLTLRGGVTQQRYDNASVPIEAGKRTLEVEVKVVYALR